MTIDKKEMIFYFYMIGRKLKNENLLNVVY